MAAAALARFAALLHVLALPWTAAGAPFELLGNGGCRTTSTKGQGPKSMAHEKADDLEHCQRLCLEVRERLRASNLEIGSSSN